MDVVAPTDLQRLFETRAGRGDILAAGRVDDVIGLCVSGGGYSAMTWRNRAG